MFDRLIFNYKVDKYVDFKNLLVVMITSFSTLLAVVFTIESNNNVNIKKKSLVNSRL